MRASTGIRVTKLHGFSRCGSALHDVHVSVPYFIHPALPCNDIPEEQACDLPLAV